MLLSQILRTNCLLLQTGWLMNIRSSLIVYAVASVCCLCIAPLFLKMSACIFPFEINFLTSSDLFLTVVKDVSLALCGYPSQMLTSFSFPSRLYCWLYHFLLVFLHLPSQRNSFRPFEMNTARREIFNGEDFFFSL